MEIISSDNGKQILAMVTDHGQTPWLILIMANGSMTSFMDTGSMWRLKASLKVTLWTPKSKGGEEKNLKMEISIVENSTMTNHT